MAVERDSIDAPVAVFAGVVRDIEEQPDGALSLVGLEFGKPANEGEMLSRLFVVEVAMPSGADRATSWMSSHGEILPHSKIISRKTICPLHTERTIRLFFTVSIPISIPMTWWFECFVDGVRVARVPYVVF